MKKTLKRVLMRAAPRPGAPFERSKSGLALFGVIVILGGLSFVGAIVYAVVDANIEVAGHYQHKQESFFQADAAVEYVRAQLNSDLRSGAITLTQEVVTVNYAAPSGYNFDTVTNLVQLANTNLYAFTATGRARTSNTKILAVLGQSNALADLGLFGDRDVQIQPGFDIYSYRSSVLLNPTAADSTGTAGAGSNLSVTLQPGVSIDGSILIGESVLGIPGTVSGEGTIPVDFTERISPDPLGAIGGELAASFAHYSIALNNDNAAVGIVGNQIDLRNHDTLNLPAGYYYLTDYSQASGSTMIFDSTPDDPAVIFLSGEMFTASNSEMVSSSGSPKALYVFSNSNEEVRIQPKSEFRGFIYAPYAHIQMQPNGDLYGVMWGATMRLQPGGDFFVDISLLEDFKSGTMKLVQWKETH